MLLISIALLKLANYNKITAYKVSKQRNNLLDGSKANQLYGFSWKYPYLIVKDLS